MAYETGLRKPELGKLISGNTKPPIWHCKKVSSATWGANSFVSRSGGLLKKVADGAAAKVFGLALEAGVPGSAIIPVLVATNDVLFSIPVDGTSTSSAVLRQGDLGVQYRIKISSAACTCIDLGNAESGATPQLERGLTEIIGAENPRVLCTIDESIREIK